MPSGMTSVPVKVAMFTIGNTARVFLDSISLIAHRKKCLSSQDHLRCPSESKRAAYQITVCRLGGFYLPDWEDPGFQKFWSVVFGSTVLGLSARVERGEILSPRFDMKANLSLIAIVGLSQPFGSILPKSFRVLKWLLLIRSHIYGDGSLRFPVFVS